MMFAGVSCSLSSAIQYDALQLNRIEVMLTQIWQALTTRCSFEFAVPDLPAPGLFHGENEQMRLPWGDDRSRSLMAELEKELLMFGMSKKGRLDSIGRHDDFAIALALAHWATTEFRERIVDLDDIMMGLLD